jgi:hypothetical protein
MSMRPRQLPATIARAVLHAALLFVAAGFFFHTSLSPRVLGKYSWGYVIFLVVVTALILSVPPLLSRGVASFLRLDKGRRAFRAMSAVAALLAFYLAAHLGYYRTLCRPHDEIHSWLGWHPMELPREVLEPKKDGELRVFCLGGSTSLGYPYPLKDMVGARDPSGLVRVAIQAQMSYTSQHSLFNYLANIRPLKPDVVIFMHGVNDYSRQFPQMRCAIPMVFRRAAAVWTTRPFRQDYGHWMGPLIFLVDPFTMEESVALQFKGHLTKFWWSDFRRPPTPHHDSRLLALPTFQRNLAYLRECCRADGTDLILLTQPFTTRSDIFRSHWLSDERGAPLCDEDFAAGMRAFNQAVREFGAKEGVPVVDLERLLEGRGDLFSDEVHIPTAEGCRIEAAAVEKELAGLLGRRGWTPAAAAGQAGPRPSP